MTLARRALSIMIALSLAFLPVGAGAMGLPASVQKAAMTAAGHDHGGHAYVAHYHGHGGMKMQMAAKDQSGAPCKGKPHRNNCCDDESNCAKSCLQKCFGPMAVLPPARMFRLKLSPQFAMSAGVEPPGWSLAPQPPPPRA